MVVAARITHALKAVAVVLRVVTDCTELACAEALLLAANDGVNIPGWAALRDRARWDGRRSADRSADGKDAYELACGLPFLAVESDGEGNSYARSARELPAANASRRDGFTPAR